MEPPITTLRTGARVELYGPMPIAIFEALEKCLRNDYPQATCSGGDAYTNLLMTITLGARRGGNDRLEIRPCPHPSRASGNHPSNSATGLNEIASTAET